MKKLDALNAKLPAHKKHPKSMTVYLTPDVQEKLDHLKKKAAVPRTQLLELAVREFVEKYYEQ